MLNIWFNHNPVRLGSCHRIAMLLQISGGSIFIQFFQIVWLVFWGGRNHSLGPPNTCPGQLLSYNQKIDILIFMLCDADENDGFLVFVLSGIDEVKLVLNVAIKSWHTSPKGVFPRSHLRRNNCTLHTYSRGVRKTYALPKSWHCVDSSSVSCSETMSNCRPMPGICLGSISKSWSQKREKAAKLQGPGFASFALGGQGGQGVMQKWSCTKMDPFCPLAYSICVCMSPSTSYVFIPNLLDTCSNYFYIYFVVSSNYFYIYETVESCDLIWTGWRCLESRLWIGWKSLGWMKIIS